MCCRVCDIHRAWRGLASVLVASAVLLSTARSTAAQRLDISTLLDQYARGDYDGAIRAAMYSGPATPTAFRHDLEQDAPRWAASDGPSSVARRRLVAATFTIDVAHAAYTGIVQTAGGQPGQDVWLLGLRTQTDATWPTLRGIVEWACTWLRSAPAEQPLEREWFLASVQLFRDFHDLDVSRFGGLGMTDLDGNMVGGELQGHLLHAVARFPNEPWLRVVNAERLGKSEESLSHRWELTMEAYQKIKGFREASVRGPDAERQQEAAMMSDLLEMKRRLLPLEAQPSVRAEVHVHLGCIALMCAQHDEARQYFGDVDPWTSDPCLRFLGHYLRGRVDEIDGRRSDAERSYREAIALMPHAQSGLTSLAELLSLDGRRAEAVTLAQQAVSVPASSIDPWTELVIGHGCTRWPDFMNALRKGLAAQ
jgi:hypothetical protein